MARKGRYRPRVIILTALPVELAAVKELLQIPNGEALRELYKNTIYEWGTFVFARGEWEVLLAQTGRGNISAALKTEQALTYFRPQAAFFLGVAGGFKDVSHGDVVAANKVYYYEAGKSGIDKSRDFFWARPNLREVKEDLIQWALKCAAANDWRKRIKTPLPPISLHLRDPKVYIEPIASGEQVFTSKKAALSERLRTHYGDAIAVEMEGFGFMKAAANHSQVYSLVIRGISDLIDDKGRNKTGDEAALQDIASRHASAFAFEVLNLLGLYLNAQHEDGGKDKGSGPTEAEGYRFDDASGIAAEASSSEATTDGATEAEMGSAHAHSQATGFAEAPGEEASAFSPGEAEEGAGQEETRRTDEEVRPSQRISNVPPLNYNFFGRENEIRELHRRYNAARAERAAFVVWAMSGAGKTQLAIKYAHQYEQDYDLVWWVRAEDRDTLMSDYAALAQELPGFAAPPAQEVQYSLGAKCFGLFGKVKFSRKIDPRVEFHAAALKRDLGQRNRWLLILDNARDSEMVRRFIPAGNRGHILITSSNPSWRGLAEPFHLPMANETEATNFLLARTGYTDRDQAQNLARALGGHLLALDQAAAFMSETGMSMAEYWQNFQNQRTRLELLRYREPANDYEFTVATVWELSFSRVVKKAPAAADLLNLCAFLAPEDIPQQLFMGNKEHLPENLRAVACQSLGFDKTVGAIKTYSLMNRKDRLLSVHPLVQVMARDRMSKEIWDTYAQTAVSLVNQAFPKTMEDPAARTRVDLLVPHAEAVLEHVKARRLALVSQGGLLTKLGAYYLAERNNAKARVSLEEALACFDRAYGYKAYGRPELIPTLTQLGLAFYELGKFPDALTRLDQARRIAQEAPQDHYYTAVSDLLFYLGRTLKALEKPEEAEDKFKESLDMEHHATDRSPLRVADRLNELGGVLLALDQAGEAKKLCERAWSIVNDHPAPEGLRVAPVAENLGDIYRKSGDLPSAEEYYFLAESIYEISLGKDDPRTKAVGEKLTQIYGSKTG
ncbi:MAG: FxSxx-COOH system tetratricopeptide repeat protein [Desulfobaccales bacterium]